MAETEQADEGRSIAERVVDGFIDGVLPFPWAGGFAAGVVAFVAEYAVIASYLLSGIGNTQLGGSTIDKLIQIGWVQYNTHGVPIVGTEAGNVVALPGNLLGNAEFATLYQLIPVVALVVASVAFTYWLRPSERSLGVAAMTGIAMAIGYLLLALVGTFLLTRSQTAEFPDKTVTVVYHPARIDALVRGLAYPLLIGALGSIPAQAVLTNEDTSENEPSDED